MREIDTPAVVFGAVAQDSDLTHAHQHETVVPPTDVPLNLGAAIANFLETERSLPGSVRTILGRVKDQFGLHPDCIIADTA